VPNRCSFEYAAVRVVPHVDREEFVNAGVIVFCDGHDFLGARIELDEARLRALAPDVDDAVVRLARLHLAAIPRVCVGGPPAGPIGKLTTRERWTWLVAPRSTILQTSAPHAGMTGAPLEALNHLVETLVRAPRRPARTSTDGPHAPSRRGRS
jgi:Protein of unknown function (DUF3037)